jgi:hypothetical protein
VTNATYHAHPGNGPVSIGFNDSWHAINNARTSFTLNNATCTVN